MADKPADDDEEETRVEEWGDDSAATEVVPASAIPTQLLEPQHTDRLRLTPAEFAGGVENAERDGYRRGFEQGNAKGYARGLAEGEAKLRAVDWGAGVEDALAGLRLYLLSEGIMHGEAFTAKVMPFIKRSG